MIMFSQYVKDFPIPCLTYGRQEGIKTRSYYLIRLFPVSLT
jgi:hypothetical protein